MKRAAMPTGAATAARPETRSVISRVVEQVKDRASALGSSVASKMPGSSSPTPPSGGGMGGSTQSSWGTGGSSGSNYGDEDEM